MKRSILLVALAAPFALIACGPVPLAGLRPSPETLAHDVLVAFAERDEGALRAFALTEGEFEHRVWPGLPAARANRNLPWHYVWTDLSQKSTTMLKRRLAEHGGRRYELKSVRFDGARTDHGTYRVHRDTVLVVRDAAAERELRLLGSMIETDRGWKVFSYVTDQ